MDYASLHRHLRDPIPHRFGRQPRSILEADVEDANEVFALLGPAHIDIVRREALRMVQPAWVEAFIAAGLDQEPGFEGAYDLPEALALAMDLNHPNAERLADEYLQTVAVMGDRLGEGLEDVALTALLNDLWNDDTIADIANVLYLAHYEAENYHFRTQRAGYVLYDVWFYPEDAEASRNVDIWPLSVVLQFVLTIMQNHFDIENVEMDSRWVDLSGHNVEYIGSGMISRAEILGAAPLIERRVWVGPLGKRPPIKELARRVAARLAFRKVEDVEYEETED